MNNRAKRIANQLGMPHGTANSRLKKLLLFDFCQRLDLDFCFKCNTKIDSIEDFSIEHKEPWEGRNAELFWKLDNIAFSHLKCNRPHSYVSPKTKKIGPEGTAWCSKCQDFLPDTEFSPVRKRWNGLGAECKEHLKLRISEQRRINKNYGREK